MGSLGEIAGGVIASLLYQVSPRDLVVLLGVGAALLGVAVLAGVVPGARATRVDPIRAPGGRMMGDDFEHRAFRPFAERTSMAHTGQSRALGVILMLSLASGSGACARRGSDRPMPLGAGAADEVLSTPDTASPTAARRAQIADTILKTITRRFPHWEAIHDIDFPRVAAGYRQAALAAETRREFSLATIAFLAHLRNGHTLFRDSFLHRTSGGEIPFSLRSVSDGWVVYESRDSRIPDGSAVRRINGVDIEAFYARRRPYLSASTERAARHMLFQHGGMEATHLLPRRLEITLEDDSNVVVERPEDPVGRDRYLVTHRWFDDGSIGYMRIPGFSPYEHRRRAEDLVTGPFHDTPALIIDVRGAWGGATPSDLIQSLMDRSWQWWSGDTYPRVSAGSYYHGALVIIIDAGCVSACEDFVMPFGMNHRAVLVGEATAGSSGQPAVLSMPEGFEAWVASKSLDFPDGTRFEGVGIMPDIQVEATIADFAASSDPELNVALDAARRALRERRPHGD